MSFGEYLSHDRDGRPFADFVRKAQQVSLRDAYAYCRRIAKESSSNFYHAFRLLPAAQRDSLCAAYAFCRFIDDLADEQAVLPPPAGDARGRREDLERWFSAWREELGRCYDGSPRHPISIALAHTVRRFPVRKEHLAGIIDGAEMDLRRQRYETFSDLYRYCYHVASLVGLVCIEIFGYKNPAARDYAVNLGLAFQMTNILRDVGEDGARGRIYLPLEDLARFHYPEASLLAGVYNRAFVRLMSFQCQRTREFYARAASHLPREDRRSLAPAEAMRSIYSRILDGIVARNYRVFDHRVTLATGHKVALALAAWTRARLPF